MSVKRTHITEDLGIQLSSKKEEELFKWFLACLLFGKPIQQQVAERAFLTLAAAGLLSPDAILRAGWDELVRLLDEAHYVRFDFSTATKLLHVSKELKERYGSLTNLLAESKTPQSCLRSCGSSSILVQQLRGSFCGKCVLYGIRLARRRQESSLLHHD